MEYLTPYVIHVVQANSISFSIYVPLQLEDDAVVGGHLDDVDQRHPLPLLDVSLRREGHFDRLTVAHVSHDTASNLRNHECEGSRNQCQD